MALRRGPRFFRTLGGSFMFDDHDFRPPVAIEIADRQARERGASTAKRGASAMRVTSAKRPLPRLRYSNVPLPIGFADGRVIHLGIDVAVGHHQIGPAVFIDIEKAAPQPSS